MNPVEASASSAEKILLAATDLFAANHFNGVSIKEIAKKSGVNSALISYYFGGKKNLYQEVLNEQSNLFLNLIARVSSKDIAPLAKLREYITAISKAIPTGEIAPVEGTPFDFTEAKPIGRERQLG